MIYASSLITTGFAAILFANNVHAQHQHLILVYPDSITKTTSLQTGACIEDVNHEIYGGIFSQMIFGESFQEEPDNIQTPGLSGHISCKAKRDVLDHESPIRSWQPVRKGAATGTFSIDSAQPFVGRQSQSITFVRGQGEIGLENRGLNREGLHLERNKPYEGSVCIKSAENAEVYLSLENADGSLTYAITKLSVATRQWQKVDFTLTPSKTVDYARLSITLRQPGEVTLGYVFLQPGEWGRFHQLPVRKDVADALVGSGISVLRYGGSMILADDYKWKNMIGPRETRSPYKGTWYRYSSNGFGIIDFLNLCEAANIIAIPDMNSTETPQDMADFVEYVNGGPNTPWGRKRINDGHPQPYNLKYLELGNEQFNDPKLTGTFRLLADAIWSIDPHIQLIFCLSDNTREDIKGDLANLKQTIDHCRASGHQAWFDVHVWNGEQNQPDLADYVFAEQKLLSIAPDSAFKLCVFEENANNATMKRALAHANILNRLQRLPYAVPIVCAANCLQVDRQNDNGWDQGLLFLNPNSVWAQPTLYVTGMVHEEQLCVTIKSVPLNKRDSLDITARKEAGGNGVSLQVVNDGGKPVAARVVLVAGGLYLKEVNISEINGSSLQDKNTATHPNLIMPVQSSLDLSGDTCDHIFPPYSFTMLHFK